MQKLILTALALAILTLPAAAQTPAKRSVKRNPFVQPQVTTPRPPPPTTASPTHPPITTAPAPITTAPALVVSPSSLRDVTVLGILENRNSVALIRDQGQIVAVRAGD